MIGSSDECSDWLQTHSSQSSKLRVTNDDGKRVLVEDVELYVKTTQTECIWEEKGLQVSRGRHSNRPLPVFLQTASQTECSPIYDSFMLKLRVYQALLKYYFTAFIIVMLSAFLAYHGLKYWKEPVPILNDFKLKQSSSMKNISSFFSNFFHKCLSCPQHRQ